MTGARSQTFKAARVTVAPDRSRQVVSERNTFPWMTSLMGGGEGKKALCSIKTYCRIVFSPHKFSARTFCLCWIKLHLQLIMNLIRTMRKT